MKKFGYTTKDEFGNVYYTDKAAEFGKKIFDTMKRVSDEFIQEINADLFSYTWIGDFADPLAFLELFRSNSTLNVTNWKNSEFDKLLDEAALYSDENHSKILAQAEQLLLNQGLIIPIQHPVSLNIIDLNSIGGWSVNSFDIHPLKYLFKKEQKINLPNVVLNY
jgi:oligopeptide transport system substrate-binding protein